MACFDVGGLVEGFTMVYQRQGLNHLLCSLEGCPSFQQIDVEFSFLGYNRYNSPILRCVELKNRNSENGPKYFVRYDEETRNFPTYLKRSRLYSVFLLHSVDLKPFVVPVVDFHSSFPSEVDLILRN